MKTIIDKIILTINNEKTKDINDYYELKNLLLNISYDDINQINYMIDKFDFWYKNNQLINNQEALIYLNMIKNLSLSTKEIITTKDELQTYNVIKNILKNSNIDINRLTYKDSPEHFDILLDSKILCRAKYNKIFMFDNKEKNIQEWQDIVKLKNDLLKYIKNNWII
jgi:hypothetical protein